MTVRTSFFIALAGVCMLAGCPQNTEIANGGTQGGGNQSGSGGSGSAGSSSGSGSGTGGSRAGGNGGGSAGANGGPIMLPGGSGGSSGTAGMSMGGGTGGVSGGGSTSCPPNLAIPTLCRVCADGKCGEPACSNGTFTGFVCTNDPADAGTGTGGTSGGGACNLACVQGKHCEVVQVQCIRAPCPAQPTCVDNADGGTTGSLHWVASCGTPVCTANPGNFDDPNIRNCTTEMQGQPCTTAGDRCDGVLGCGATLLCATMAPVTCPISRAKYKQEIDYLDANGRAQYHDQITRMPLASYRYKDAPDVPQLGFIIDDIEPSVAVSGDHVNLYGYLSMAVAAIQVQDKQIKALEQQLEQMRARLDESSSQAVCGPAAR